MSFDGLEIVQSALSALSNYVDSASLGVQLRNMLNLQKDIIEQMICALERSFPDANRNCLLLFIP